MKPLRRVVQHNYEAGDCGLACAAMITGEPYEQVLAIFRSLPGKEKTGQLYTTHKDLQSILLSFGVQTTRVKFQGWRKLQGHAIVKVRAQVIGPWHWVVLDGGRSHQVVHDPEPGMRQMVRDFRKLKGSGFAIVVNS